MPEPKGQAEERTDANQYENKQRRPGNADERNHQFNEGRDLALTTDFRAVVGEILTKHLGVKDLVPVFPGFDNNPHKFTGLIRS